MSQWLRPEYRFEFMQGISTSGVLKRSGPWVAREHVRYIPYSFDDLPLVSGTGERLPPNAADLIDVCTAIVLADRLAPRHTEGDPRPPHDRWHRRILVKVAVRHPETWARSEIADRLQELLGFLTDDQWTTDFSKRTALSRPSEVQSSYLPTAARTTSVALHSGGLDSLFGLVELVTRSTLETITPVTVATNDRVLAVADAVVQKVRSTGWADVPDLQPAYLRMSVSGEGRAKDDRESSQRARSLLFLAAGIGGAVARHTDRLQITENGVGAIGLPTTPDHWGARATKAMHPKTLSLFGEIASLVLDRTMAIDNNGLFATKGELAQRALSNGRFAPAARSTVSCDRAPYLELGHACGQCTSCILRRTALLAAGLEDEIGGRATTYNMDWLDPTTQFSGEASVPLFAMRNQVETLRTTVGEGKTLVISTMPFQSSSISSDLPHASDFRQTTSKRI